MGDSGDDIMEQIDWEHLLDNSLEDLNFFVDGSTLPLDDIEHLLMKDDVVDDVDSSVHELSDGLLSDILLDSPIECAGSGDVVDVPECRNLKSLEEAKDASEDKENNNNKDDEGDADEPISNKRKRQLRNRDAAARSRERKKMYIRDLEMKSRYFEGECKRLGMLLHCVLAENQALRLSLQNSKAFDASITKQESAVLLLESLLLGSLLWLLGIVCLLILPASLPSTLEAVPLEIKDNKNRGGLAPRKAASKIFPLLICQSFNLMGKRCKASRSRMKPNYLVLV